MVPKPKKKKKYLLLCKELLQLHRMGFWQWMQRQVVVLRCTNGLNYCSDAVGWRMTVSQSVPTGIYSQKLLGKSSS